MVSQIICLHIAVAAKTTVKDSCEFPIGQNICAVIKFKNGVSRKNDSPFEIKFETKDKKLIKIEKRPEMKLWMVMKSGHGHGSDELEIIPQKNGASYFVKNVWFMMLGQWQLKINLFHEGKSYNTELPICVYKLSDKSGPGNCL